MNIFIQKTIRMYEKYKWWFYFAVGIAVLFVFLIPYFTLRENAYFMIHDELDDGIFKYVLYAKNMGINGSFIPEFMGGQERYTITVSSFFGILIYKLFDPYDAFAIMLTITVFTAFLGVYLIGKELTDNAFASFFAASCFSYLPFKSMFALNIVGFPLFFWIMIKLYRCKGRQCIIPFLALIFYASGITLAWGGFMSIGLLTAFTVIFLILKLISYFNKKSSFFVAMIPDRYNLLYLIIGDIILTAIQTVTSFDLIINTFGNNAPVSHREEMILNARNDHFNYFKELMFIGGSHSECSSRYLAISALLLIIALPIIFHILKKHDRDIKDIVKKYRSLVFFYVANILNALFSLLWMSGYSVNLRQDMGGIFKTFQLNRIYWMMPACWMCILALEIAILLDIAKLIHQEKILKKWRFLSTLAVASSAAIMFLYAKNVYLSSPVYHNLRLMVFPETYHTDTWKDYYAKELFDEIKGAIGKPTDEYRVVNIGINPAVALMNGLYTIDGYSTDYPLEYKHEFRKIMEGELDKNEGNKAYFDNWGNRCYIFADELGISTGLYNDTDIIENLDIDTSQIKKMGAEYILSAAKIQNNEELFLKESEGSPFSKDGYSYKIWIYKIEDR